MKRAEIGTNESCETMFIGPGASVVVAGNRTAIEDLKAGDQLESPRGELFHVLWAQHLRFGVESLWQRPELTPVRISAGALGEGLPEADMVVSLGQPVHVPGRSNPVPAEQLLHRRGVALARDLDQVSYTRVLLGQPGEIWANGVACSSFQPEEVQIARDEPEVWAEIAPLLTFPSAY